MRYWTFACALTLLAVSADAQRRSVPRGSFLSHPARSTEALLKQFDTHPEVQRRYINIFGRSKEEVREILARLKPKTLLESHVYPVGYYSASGKWRYRDKMLVKGTKVFVTPEGKPFLKEECGNPIIVTLPYPIANAKPSRPPIRVPESLEAPPLKIVVTPVPSPETIFPPEGLFTPPLQTTPPIASFPPVELLTGDIDTPLFEVGPEGSPGVLSTPRFPAAGDNPYWLALLLPLFFLNGGGHGPGPPGPLVPEASGWVLMLAAGLGVGLVVCKERSRTRQR